MHKIIYLFLLFSIYSNAQVIPIGTVIKGKRLQTLFSENVPNEDNNSATLYGSIKINDSKLSIVENGFVILLSSDAEIRKGADWDKIEPFVSKAFTLKRDRERQLTEIVSGYFTN